MALKRKPLPWARCRAGRSARTMPPRRRSGRRVAPAAKHAARAKAARPRAARRARTRPAPRPTGRMPPRRRPSRSRAPPRRGRRGSPLTAGGESVPAWPWRSPWAWHSSRSSSGAAASAACRGQAFVSAPLRRAANCSEHFARLARWRRCPTRSSGCSAVHPRAAATSPARSSRRSARSPSSAVNMAPVREAVSGSSSSASWRCATGTPCGCATGARTAGSTWWDTCCSVPAAPRSRHAGRPAGGAPPDAQRVRAAGGAPAHARPGRAARPSSPGGWRRPRTPPRRRRSTSPFMTELVDAAGNVVSRADPELDPAPLLRPRRPVRGCRGKPAGARAALRACPRAIQARAPSAPPKRWQSSPGSRRRGCSGEPERAEPARGVDPFACVCDTVVAPEPALPAVRDTDAVASFDRWLAVSPRLNRLGLRAGTRARGSPSRESRGRRRCRRARRSRARRAARTLSRCAPHPKSARPVPPWRHDRAGGGRRSARPARGPRRGQAAARKGFQARAT